jgi:fructose-bisphosphate aldolase class II
MLVNNAAILQGAYEGRYAVGAFNANNLEQIQGILTAAEEERSPVILQASQGAIRYVGLDIIAAMVLTFARTATVPVSLHLDHGTSFEQNVRCLRAGFTSLMFDGSLLPFEENVDVTRKVVEIAHPVGVSVEGEIGRVGGTEEGLEEEDIAALLTEPEEAERFAKLTSVDALAISVGNVHRMKTQSATLDIPRIRAVRELTEKPLVLHGASGVTNASIVKAVRAGICKINVATALNMAFMHGVSTALKASPREIDPRKILRHGREELKEKVKEKIRLFGSSGSATSVP